MKRPGFNGGSDAGEMEPLAGLVQHLRSTQHLCESSDGVLVVGPATERDYGRGHYRDLMASFSSSPMLQGRHGTSEIGLIDPTSLLSREKLPSILLGGRSWRVLDVDWRKGIAWLEPTSVSGKARWQGSARDVSSEAAEALRRVLQSEDNRTLARGLPAMAHRARYDEFKVEWEGPRECIEQLPAVVASPSDDELESLADSVKFSQLMPRELFARLVAARLWDAQTGIPAAPSSPPGLG